MPDPEARGVGGHERLRLLVIGGSQGARALNEGVPRALRELAPKDRPEVWHQAGPRNYEATRDGYRLVSVQARVEPFIEDMAAAYAWADLVLCRSGALTVAELEAAGVGAVLVPFPFAVDDHQSVNAQQMVSAGAAVLLPQAQMEPARLCSLLSRLKNEPGRLLSMARAARSLAMPDATRQVADACLEVAEPVTSALGGER